MSDLSEKFGNLMARMAKTDAELFRTIGEHNRSVTEQVMDLTQEEPPTDGLALPAQALLPYEERGEDALKKRFKTCKATFEWIEEQLGPPPSKKKSWSIAVQTITSGKWECGAVSTKTSSTTNSQILKSLEDVNGRLDRIESTLNLLLTALTSTN